MIYNLLMQTVDQMEYYKSQIPMKIYFSNLKLVFILLILVGVEAQSEDIDLQLEINLEPYLEVNRGDVIPFTLIVTNHGPSGAALPASINTVIIFNDVKFNNNTYALNDIAVTKDESVVQNCSFGMIYGDDTIPPPKINFVAFYTVFMPIIPANSSITCYGKIEIVMQHNRSVKIDLYARPQPFDNDVNLSNNTKSVAFLLLPTNIPVLYSKSIYFLLFLILIVGMGFVHLRNKPAK